MQIDWTNFSPWSALVGGLLIGLASALLLLLNGRVAGISGILGGMLRAPAGEFGWRLAFVAGLVVSPLVYRLFAPLPAMRVEASTTVLALAGLLVGIGTRYAGGCTSGHGVCGVARLSPRSLAATGIFMLAGFATVFLVRHAL
ncbi:MAG: YeeE/YedE family protein [Pseudomonadota bacterium]